jgi:hypothetical protein
MRIPTASPVRVVRALFLLAVLFALAAAAPQVRACSQCMCGTPFPADVLGGTIPMQLRYGFEDRYLSKSNALDEGPGDELEQEHRVAAFGLWRPNDRLALLGRLPYAVKELTERPLGEVETSRTSRGIGDAEAQALIELGRTSAGREAWLAMVLGGTAPTGSNELKDETGQRLDAHLQPGSGAWSGTAGFHLALRAHPGLLDVSVMGRLNGTNTHGYHYGNTLLYNAGWASRDVSGWQANLQMNGRSAARDQTEEGTLDENTGGTVLYLSPGFRWRGWQGLGLEAAVQIPVLETLYGVQDEHTTARLALSLGR